MSLKELQKAQEPSLPKEASPRKRYRIILKTSSERDNFDEIKELIEVLVNHSPYFKETDVLEIMVVKK